jgi:long-chain acyl-CoA synthetase
VFAVAFALARFFPFLAVKRLLFRPIHRRFGNRLRAFVVGGAPLPLEVEGFLERIGLTPYQGYGLSETSPVTTYNAPGRRRRGSVGRPLPGVELSIGDGGEILTRGPHLMRGYFRRPDLTDAQIDRDGWFHTGDLGSLDQGGFLYIKGRIKNLIVLPSGKKVQPEEVETAIGRSTWFQEVCVLGCSSAEGGEEVCAVVVPSQELRQRLGQEPQRAEQEIRSEVERACAVIAPFKRPAHVVVRREELPKTSTRKVKRPQVRLWLEDVAQRSRAVA